MHLSVAWMPELAQHGLLMVPCQQGKLGKCSHSCQRGTLKGSVLCPGGIWRVPVLQCWADVKCFSALCARLCHGLCVCTKKLVLIFAQSLSFLAVSGTSCPRIPVVRPRPISHSYYKDSFYPRDGICHCMVYVMFVDC